MYTIKFLKFYFDLILFRRTNNSKVKNRLLIMILFDFSDCDCEYEYKNGLMGIPKASGCKIKKALPRGYKCDCSYMGAYTCSGSNE